MRQAFGGGDRRQHLSAVGWFWDGLFRRRGAGASAWPGPRAAPVTRTTGSPMFVGWGERGAGGRRAQFGAWRVRRGCALLAFFTQDAYARRDARGARKRPAGGRARAPHRRRRKPQPIPAARPARQRAAASARAALKATPAGGGRRRPTAFGAAVRVRPDPQRRPPGDSPAAGGVARTCSDQSPAAHTRRSAFALRGASSQGEGWARPVLVARAKRRAARDALDRPVRSPPYSPAASVMRPCAMRSLGAIG